MVWSDETKSLKMREYLNFKVCLCTNIMQENLT